MLRRYGTVFGFCIITILLASLPAHAVLLHGELRNSDTSTPADQDITFISYVSGTDNEIQTESTVTQNYSSGFWSIETQNFTPTPPGTGDDIVILFTNVSNGESASLSTTVPASLTNYGTITLASSTNPSTPTGLLATPGPPGTITLTWTTVGGVTYRIYRHLISGGAYDRIAAGVAGTPYVDSTTDGVSAYYYTLIADSGSALSGHSVEVSADSALPVLLSSLTASATESGVELQWRTESEYQNLGFNVYRGDMGDGRSYQKINRTLIAGGGTVNTQRDYSFVDDQAKSGKTYYYYIEDISLAGKTNRSYIIEAVMDDKGLHNRVIPTHSALLPNFPNPFNPETWIPYHLAQDSEAELRIYDTRGYLVRTLELGTKRAGMYESKLHAAYWDGRNSVGETVSSGVYFYQLITPTFQQTRRLVVVR